MEDDFVTISIDSSFTNNYAQFFNEELLREYYRAILNGYDNMKIKYKVYNQILKQKEDLDLHNFRINETARLNNLGIMLEEKGEIDTAISVYEENIKIGYSATHSFDRLMIIYHKLKQYNNERRVIEIAIRIFTNENNKRMVNAIDNNPELKVEIEKAFISNSRYFATNGKCLYNPYDLTKWNNRLLKLLNK